MKPAAFCGACNAVKIFLILVTLAGAGKLARSQDASASPASQPQADTQPQPDTQPPSFTFTAITRMVVLQVVARDSEDNPVRDLTEKDLQISEQVGTSAVVPQKTASFRALNDLTAQPGKNDGVMLSAPVHLGFCKASGIYELSYYLSTESRKDGLHHVSISSPRGGLTFYFRKAYKIEADKSIAVSPYETADKQEIVRLQNAEKAKEEEKKNPGLALAVIACSGVSNAPPFPLALRKTGKHKDNVTYEMTVPSQSLAFAGPSGAAHRVSLAAAVCTFDFQGTPLRFFENMIDQTLSDAEYQSALTAGFTHAMEFRAEEASTARVVVRNLANGAVGAGMLRLAQPIVPLIHLPDGIQPTTSFGTTSPSATGFCGDVYTLPPATVSLPRFSALQPVAPLYATALNVFSKFFTEGIPGVTSRTEWLGINYQGSFWLQNADTYEFELTSDDGAKLYIDDKLIIDNDGVHSAIGRRGKVQINPGEHHMRVAYFQGPPVQAALILLVKTPGTKWKLFDTRDFSASQSSPR
jgi:hypothetical protein